MRNNYSMEGWMFAGYLALPYYYKIYHKLIQKEILSSYSSSDVVLHLGRYRKAETQDKWVDLEIPKQTRGLMEKLDIPIPIT